MRRLGLLPLLLACLPLLATACGGNCRQLNELLCRCRDLTSVELQACYAEVRSEESQVEPSTADEEFCAQKLETCDCATLETAEGKRACGLAY
jgi:hypothetical protein